MHVYRRTDILNKERNSLNLDMYSKMLFPPIQINEMVLKQLSCGRIFRGACYCLRIILYTCTITIMYNVQWTDGEW